jgi:3-oxoacyl-[acyl-carrier protein] reductase
MRKTVLVSGGTGTIGSEIIKGLSRDGNQYNIVFIYNTNERYADELKKFSSCECSIIGIKKDLSLNGSITEIKNYFREEKIEVDVLINCIGVKQDELFINSKLEHLENVIKLNTLVPMSLAQILLPYMISKHAGTIITFSSIAGIYGNLGQVSYSTSKAALNGFTKSLSKEIARFGILINNIAPGMVESDMVDSIPSNKRRELLDRTSTHRFIKSEEIYKLVNFLISENSSITGETLEISGQLNL